MSADPDRSRAARKAAETALVHVVHAYGARPEFVVLGGLVPEVLCSLSDMQHAGTTDIDVQTNLEIASASVNASRLEQALRDAGFTPSADKAWRWVTASDGLRTQVKFELLADLDDQRPGAVVMFSDCKDLGAANLRGTGFAAEDVVIRTVTAHVEGIQVAADAYFAGLAGFLLAKAAAARGRGAPKDWYDIAFVLLHNDMGGVQPAIDHRHASRHRVGAGRDGERHSRAKRRQSGIAHLPAEAPR